MSSVRKALENRIIWWAEERGITNIDKQALRVCAEAGEVAQAIAIEDDEEAVMELGDLQVTMIILAKLKGFDLEECLQLAYDKISARKTKVVNGTAVKE